MDKEINSLKILYENKGRNNYGPKVVAHTQNKGILGGVMEDIHYISNFKHYSLDFEDLSFLDFNQTYDGKTPSFYKFNLNLEEVKNTFIDVSNYGKGLILVNGFNIGRYWNIGPTQYLYAPDSLWNIGDNEVIIFETEGIEINELSFSANPVY